MDEKKQISIDAWNTIIMNNLDWAPRKCDLVREFFNIDATDTDIGSAQRKVKNHYEELVERYGIQPPLQILFAEWLNNLGVETTTLKITQFSLLYQKAIQDFPARPLEPSTGSLLAQLSDKYAICLISNTLFTHSEAMLAWFDQMDWLKYFSSTRFSDKYGVSKPDSWIMSKLSTAHIGDNPATDGEAARRLNIPFIHVYGSSSNTLADAYKLLTGTEPAIFYNSSPVVAD